MRLFFGVIRLCLSVMMFSIIFSQSRLCDYNFAMNPLQHSFAIMDTQIKY